MKRKFRNRGWFAVGWPVTAGLAGGLLLVCAACAAQYRPTVTEKVDSVPKGGFYRIVLPPSFVAGCRADLSDLRIYDQNGNETPYVLKAGDRDTLNAGFQSIPDPEIRRKDSSNRHTYYRIRYDDAYRIDRLSFVIANPVLFKREAFISSPDFDAGIAEAISIDPTDTVFRGPPMKARELLIDINNKDNPPLVISRVATAQSGIYLVVLLRGDRRYMLVAGDPSVRAPEYDLHYFTDSLTSAPPVLGLGLVHRENRGTVVGDTGARGAGAGNMEARRSGLLLWGLVALILLLLIYVSVKLARAVDQKGKE